MLTDLGKKHAPKILALFTQSFLYAHKRHFFGRARSLFPGSQRWRKTSVSIGFTDSFTCFCSVRSALCACIWVCARAHSDRIALFRIFPPDCPNKPEQTGRRHCGDVTHSSEPWRLSAWRRSGGLHGDVKQESAHSGTPPFTCVARGALRTNRLRSFCRSFITLKQRDEITAPRTCRAAAVSRSYKGVRTQTSCSIPSNDRHSLRYY